MILRLSVTASTLVRCCGCEARGGAVVRFRDFNRGDYYGAVEEKVSSETISKILYPNDEQSQGKRLRLGATVFFAACSIKDMLRKCISRGLPIERFHEMYCIQLNDTHPAIAVAELMHRVIWISTACHGIRHGKSPASISPTQTTRCSPEALEKWPLPLFGSVLPRHLEIIYEINKRFLDEVRGRYPGEEEEVSAYRSSKNRGISLCGWRTSRWWEAMRSTGSQGSLPSLLRHSFFAISTSFDPAKFFNVTNGVTPRRFIALSNPELARLIRTDRQRLAHRPR